MLKYGYMKVAAAIATVSLSGETLKDEIKEIKNSPENHPQKNKLIVSDQIRNDQLVETDNEQRKKVVLKKTTNRYSGIPSIPADIGYSKQSDRTSVAASVLKNPAVIAGMGLTVLALLGMLRSSVVGDRVNAQRFMRYRIYAQFFTFFSVVVGVIYLTEKLARQDEKEKKKHNDALKEAKKNL